MHDFRYKKNQLFCEGVSVRDVAGQVGTPFYLYSRNTLVDHYAKLKKAFAPVNPLICFSVKANSNIAVLKTLVDEGAGLDIVSGGELHRAGLAGADPGKIVYAGVGKTAEEMDSALGAGILFFNAESLEEIKALNERAGALRKSPWLPSG